MPRSPSQLLVSTFNLMLYGCITFCSILSITKQASADSPTIRSQNSEDPQKIKNIIIVIGDGMGPQQIGLLQEFAKHAKKSPYKNRQTSLESFAAKGVMGLSRTGSFETIAVDSACSATQLATGVSSGSEMLGLDHKGFRVETILEKAKRLGKSTGLVSDTRLTHATPAAFASHISHRSLENDIAEQMIQTGVDVMLSGGIRHFIPKSTNTDPQQKAALQSLVNEPSLKLKSKRTDDRNLLLEAQSADYHLAFNRSQLQKSPGSKLLGLFSYSGMADGITHTKRSNDPTRAEPSLAEMTSKALSTLDRNPEGFFLMVEGGQIDWASHDNDAGTLLHEMLKFDEALGVIYQYAQNREDTLVVITADHETGGFSFSYSRKNLPEARPLPGDGFEGIGYKPNYNFASFDLLDKLYDQSMSFENMWLTAGGDLGGTLPSAESLMAIMNSHSTFKVSLEQAERIITLEPNPYQTPGHPYQDRDTYPKFDNFEAFYVYGDDDHLDLMGRQLSADQNIVWSTGTHTHTPVTVIAYGPRSLTQSFTGLTNHVSVGARLKSLF